MNTVEVLLSLLELDSDPGLQVGEQFQVLVQFADIRGVPPAGFFPQSVFSGYADINFDPSLLQIDGIDFNDSFFPLAQTGTINNEIGLIDEAGAVSGFFSGISADVSGPVLTLNLTALAAGNTTLTSDAGEDIASEILIYGEDNDQQNKTRFGDLPLEILDGSTGPTDNDVFFTYDRFLRYQNLNAAIPSDAVNGLQIARLFDESFYRRQSPDVTSAISNGVFSSGYEHFLLFGRFEGRNPSILYNEAFYLDRYSDIQQAVTDGRLKSGLEHFLSIGHEERRAPSSVFSQTDYLTNYSDVAAAVDNDSLQSAFAHYIHFGAGEDRLPQLSLYSEGYYLANNSDVARAVTDGLQADGFTHFVIFGQGEQRNPSSHFNQASYLAANPDVQAALDTGLLISAFQHYEQYGRFEDRALG